MTGPEEPTLGEPATEEELFYADLADHLERETLPFLNQVLRQMVMLTAALFAGLVTFSDRRVFPVGWLSAGAAPLLVSLACCLAGILPATSTAPRREPYLIKPEIEAGVRYKSRCLRLGAGFLFAALVILFIGLFVANP